MNDQLARILFIAFVLVVCVCLTVHISRLAINGLLERKMRSDRHGNEVHGDEAIKLAKIYLFVAGVCMPGALFMLFCLIGLIRWVIINDHSAH